MYLQEVFLCISQLLPWVVRYSLNSDEFSPRCQKLLQCIPSIAIRISIAFSCRILQNIACFMMWKNKDVKKLMMSLVLSKQKSQVTGKKKVRKKDFIYILMKNEIQLELKCFPVYRLPCCRMKYWNACVKTRNVFQSFKM